MNCDLYTENLEIKVGNVSSLFDFFRQSSNLLEAKLCSLAVLVSH